MSTARLVAFAIALLVTLPGAPALAWPTLDPEGPRTALLGGRWTVLLGPSASTAPAVSDPRGPRPREELDGIAAMRAEDGRLAVRATLLFATRPVDLEAVVRTLPAPCEGAAIAPFANEGGIVGITCTEPSPDGAFRPLVLYAAHTDGWVDRFEVQLETDEATDPALAAAFAEAVARSLRAEPVAPAVFRGTIEIASACASGDAEDRLTVTLPEDWIAARNGDDQLSVIQLVRVGAMGARRPIASIALSSVSAPPARIPAGLGSRRPGSLLAQEVEWLQIVGPGDLPGIREVALALSVACGDGAPSWTAMVQLSAGGPSDTLDESTRVLETLALEGARGHVAAITGVETEEEAPPEVATIDPSVEAEAVEQTSHLWSMGIGAASLALLALAVVLRSRTTRPK